MSRVDSDSRRVPHGEKASFRRDLDVNVVSVASDNPIRKPEEDTLGRTKVARSFAAQILSLDASQGVVVGVLGAWGSGKTSFVNIAKAYLDEAKVPIFDFNPWMFSGAEQLVERFFDEIFSQLKIRPGFAEVGKSLEEYGEILSGLNWIPVVGPWIERGHGATKKVAELLQRRKEGRCHPFRAEPFGRLPERGNGHGERLVQHSGR